MTNNATIDSSVHPELIAPDAIIHPGCRISGPNTCIGPGSVIGEEGPVTLHNCQLESRVSLKGGFFSEATFLDGASFGSGAHVRPETLMEEGSSCAHTVGLKQTILMPFSVLGSLINFCDCLLSGGTGPKNHSEVGSSYIHFNFTPHQDKATASLMGDVPRGVMMDQSPIFLGGQGGLVGPTRLAFGTVVAAGTILRKDVIEPGQLVYGQASGPLRMTPYSANRFGNLDRIITNNLHYIGNQHALAAWYQTVRPLFMTGPIRALCLTSAQTRIQRMIDERIKRLDELATKVRLSTQQTAYTAHASHGRLLDAWPKLKATLAQSPAENTEARTQFVKSLGVVDAKQSYVTTIQSLPASSRTQGVAWLQSVVDSVTRLW